jgi:hypothetical protein
MSVTGHVTDISGDEWDDHDDGLEQFADEIPASAVLRAVPNRNGQSLQVRWQWRDEDRKTRIKYLAPLDPVRTKRKISEHEREQVRLPKSRRA